VKVWSSKPGIVLLTLKGHSGPVFSVAYSPNGQYIASGSWDDSVRVWDAKLGNCVAKLEGHSKQVYSVAYSPNGLNIVSGSGDKSVRIWEYKEYVKKSMLNILHIFHKPWKCIKILNGHLNEVRSVVYSPDGLNIASASFDKTIKLWNAETGACLHTLVNDSNGLYSVVFSPNGQYIASGSLDKSLKIWNAASYELVKTFGESSFFNYVHSVAYSPDGKNIAVGLYEKKNIKIFNVSNLLPQKGGKKIKKKNLKN
jgi:WD40 repeat protein